MKRQSPINGLPHPVELRQALVHDIARLGEYLDRLRATNTMLACVTVALSSGLANAIVKYGINTWLAGWVMAGIFTLSVIFGFLVRTAQDGQSLLDRMKAKLAEFDEVFANIKGGHHK